MIATVAVDPGRVDRRSSTLRVLSILLTLLLALTALGGTWRLIGELVRGAPDLHSAPTLLKAGAAVWFDTVLAFRLLCWALDSGGAVERPYAPSKSPDLAFPQQMSPISPRRVGCRRFPTICTWVFTNALAFSPTDAMPLARWAKLLMALQAVISFAILSLVIANAMNILG